MAKLPDFLTSDTAKQFYSDAVRHALVGLAGILVARGYLQGSQVAGFIEAGMAIAVVWVWQIYENLNQAKATVVLKGALAGAHETLTTMMASQAQAPTLPKT